MLKDKTMSAHLLPLGVWLFQEIFLKLAAIFLSFSFRLQVKGKGFSYYHIIALKRTNSIEVFFPKSHKLWGTRETQGQSAQGNFLLGQIGKKIALHKWVADLKF